MRQLSVQTLKASLLLLALATAMPLSGAEKEKEKPASFVGLTKEQVYTRLGDPRSQITAGAREVMFFAKVKLTLRNNVVVESEEISDEQTPKRTPEVAVPTTPAPAPEPADATDASKARKGGAPQSQPATPTPTPAPADSANPKPGDAAAGETKTPSTSPLEIKSVRPPSSTVSRPTKAPTKATSTTPPVPGSSSPASASSGAASTTSAPKPAPATPPAGAPKSVTIAPAQPATTATPSTPIPVPPSGPSVATETATAPSPTPASMPADEKSDKTATPASATDTPPADATTAEAPVKKNAPKRFFRRLTDADEELPTVTIFTTQTVIFGLAVIGGIAFLVWRGRQRRLLLEVTTVSNTPFASEAVAADTGAVFTADLLAKLEWKRFEELVAAYYVKTGVIAVRTKTGPNSPVHLKISWKGESKPFACVQCHSNPIGLIRPGPLQELNTALTAADIRRGYVVTNGKFNVEARDFAEEKHFTLLPGDILLEKLNALPPPARTELLHQITQGDYSTASCPKCDARMVRSDDGGWRCPKCETVLAPKKA
jgi:hypothetical protein